MPSEEDVQPGDGGPSRPRKLAMWMKVCLVVFVCCAVLFGVILRGQAKIAVVFKGIEEKGGGFDSQSFGKGLLQSLGISTKHGFTRVLIGAFVPKPTADELEGLRGAPFLSSLYLMEGDVDESLSKLLGDLRLLKSLHLIDYGLTDQDLRRVMESLRSPSQLGGLELRNTSLTDEGLATIGGKAPLHALMIDGSKIKGGGLLHVNLSELRILHLKRSNISDTGLAEIGRQNCSLLCGLRLDNNPVTDTGLNSLQGLTSLYELGVGGTEVTPGGLAELLKKLPITILGLNDLSWTMEDLQRLSLDTTTLKGLELAGWNIGDTDLKSLPNMPNLTSLDLSRTRVTDEGLKELVRFPKLNSIQLDGTQITIQGLKSLQKSFTLWRISISKTGLTCEDLMELPTSPILQVFTLDGMNLSMDQLRKLGRQHPNAIFRSDNRIVFPQNY
ncbi:MAG: hypothetical protein KDA68_18580 [Planctomycetaceae bacterium]|nr:hypothetical protein [Planctomycetaceae bacterium]